MVRARVDAYTRTERRHFACSQGEKRKPLLGEAASQEVSGLLGDEFTSHNPRSYRVHSKKRDTRLCLGLKRSLCRLPTYKARLVYIPEKRAISVQGSVGIRPCRKTGEQGPSLWLAVQSRNAIYCRSHGLLTAAGARSRGYRRQF